MVGSNGFVLTDLPSDEGCAGYVRGRRMRRCVGCAKCISTAPGACAIDDEATPMLAASLAADVLEIRTSDDGGQFPMPMRKVVERLENILQAFTDAGGNVPLDRSAVGLSEIRIVLEGGHGPDFEELATKMLLNGPVVRISFTDI